MKLQKPLFLFAFLFIALGTLSFTAVDVSAQDRFDSGDDTDDLGGGGGSDSQSDSDTSTGSTSSDSTTQDDGSRFDSGDDTDDTGGDSQTQETEEEQQTQQQEQEDDGSRFDSGDDTDDTGGDSLEDDGSRFDSGDDEDDVGEEPDTQPGTAEPGTGTGNYITIDPLNLTNRNITIQALPSQVSPGEEVSITGSIDTNQYIEGMPIEILLNGEPVDTIEIEGKEFSTTLSSNQQGINTVTAELLDASRSTDFQVGQGTGLQILSTSTSGDITAGNTIEVCSEIQSPQDANIRFYANGNLQESTTGSGEVCFDATVQEGSNTFEVEATLGEDTVTDAVTRNTLVPDIPGGEGNGGLLNGMTGNFSDAMSGFGSGLGSPGLRWLFSILVGVSMAAAILL